MTTAIIIVIAILGSPWVLRGSLHCEGRERTEPWMIPSLKLC